MPPRKINLVRSRRRSGLAKVFDPHIAGDINDSQAKVGRSSARSSTGMRTSNEDEAFLVLRGSIAIDFRDGAVELGEGDFIVVPKTVEHRPRSLTDGAGRADVRAGDDAQHRQCQATSRPD